MRVVRYLVLHRECSVARTPFSESTTAVGVILLQKNKSYNMYIYMYCTCIHMYVQYMYIHVLTRVKALQSY